MCSKMNTQPPAPNLIIWQQTTAGIQLYCQSAHLADTRIKYSEHLYLWKPCLEMNVISAKAHMLRKREKISWQNPLSSTKRFSVGNFEPDIPYSVGKTCHKHISQHPLLGSGKSVTICMENSANPEWSSMVMLGISVSPEMQNANYSLGKQQKGGKVHLNTVPLFCSHWITTQSWSDSRCLQIFTWLGLCCR